MDRFRPALLTLLTAACATAQVSTEIIGWTTRDRQVYGPALRYLVNDTRSGLHAVWKDDLSSIRYNFRPHGGVWRWPEGTVVNSWPRNLGCLDVSRSDSRPFISTDFFERGTPQLSYFADTAVGCGVFVEREFSSGARNNLVACANFGTPKFAAVRNDTLYYRSSFASLRIGHVGPFPAHNLAVSKQTGRFGYIWAATSGPDRGRLYLKETPNHGQDWYPTRNLSDSVPSSLNRSLLGACATYDTTRIHLVADLYDGNDLFRVQLWHFCPGNQPPWSLVSERSHPATFPIGDQALFACRPSIAIDRRRRDSDLAQLCVVWEEFDPENIDPRTGLARADIWACRSADNGRSWGAPVRLTRPDSTSKRFPFVAEAFVDTIYILYFADRIAGFWEQGQGDSTRNPVVLLAAPTELLPTALAEPGPTPPDRPVASATVLGRDAALPLQADAGRVNLLDAFGRRVLTFDPHRPTPPATLHGLPAGVYFAVGDTVGHPRCRRIVKIH
uniref:T9SS type A sorting domain-containing protein n=1 Tax=candidate division WOR-3 bacterium TaxID=2052148 RepID=A0A7C4GGJ2_UNCW3